MSNNVIPTSSNSKCIKTTFGSVAAQPHKMDTTNFHQVKCALLYGHHAVRVWTVLFRVWGYLYS